jgi:alanine-glyoxylate transaminase/serine-glyoxylate transaminase/serine-pyruvate transaminase
LNEFFPHFQESEAVMSGRNHLFVPGPTNVPERVQRAMLAAMQDHRSPDFPPLANKLLADLRPLFGSQAGQPFIFPSSGTGAWEAALTNTLSPGDRVIAPRFGQFSALWVDMMQRLGLNVEVLDEDWGEAASTRRIQECLANDSEKRIKAVCVVHNETATGVTSDIAAIRWALDRHDHPALLLVDGVSSLGSLDFRMDEWGVDVAITGSQKGLMLPAGLGIVCVSPKALLASQDAHGRRVFFSFADMQRANVSGYFPYTPALPLLLGLKEALAMLREEGLPNVVARHHRLAEGVRRAVKAWGMAVCARRPEIQSDTVTTVMVPEGADGKAVIHSAYARYNLSLGIGLGPLAGKAFRIGHLGDLNELSLAGALAGAEMSMLDAGMAVEPGSGMGAAMRYWQSQPQAAGQPRLQRAA